VVLIGASVLLGFCFAQRIGAREDGGIAIDPIAEKPAQIIGWDVVADDDREPRLRHGRALGWRENTKWSAPSVMRTSEERISPRSFTTRKPAGLPSWSRMAQRRSAMNSKSSAARQGLSESLVMIVSVVIAVIDHGGTDRQTTTFGGREVPGSR
jgi:hypothetical protein